MLVVLQASYFLSYSRGWTLNKETLMGRKESCWKGPAGVAENGAQEVWNVNMSDDI